MTGRRGGYGQGYNSGRQDGRRGERHEESTSHRRYTVWLFRCLPSFHGLLSDCCSLRLDLEWLLLWLVVEWLLLWLVGWLVDKIVVLVGCWVIVALFDWLIVALIVAPNGCWVIVALFGCWVIVALLDWLLSDCCCLIGCSVIVVLIESKVIVVLVGWLRLLVWLVVEWLLLCLIVAPIGC